METQQQQEENMCSTYCLCACIHMLLYLTMPLAIMNTPTNHTPTPLEYFSKNTAHVHINLVNWNVAVPWGMRTDRLQEKKIMNWWTNW